MTVEEETVYVWNMWLYQQKEDYGRTAAGDERYDVSQRAAAGR